MVEWPRGGGGGSGGYVEVVHSFEGVAFVVEGGCWRLSAAGSGDEARRVGVIGCGGCKQEIGHRWEALYDRFVDGRRKYNAANRSAPLLMPFPSTECLETGTNSATARARRVSRRAS